MKGWQNMHIECMQINKLTHKQLDYINDIEKQRVQITQQNQNMYYHFDRQSSISLAELIILTTEKYIQLTQGQWLQIIVAVILKYKEIININHGNLIPNNIWIMLVKGKYGYVPEITQIEIVIVNYGSSTDDFKQLQAVCLFLLQNIPDLPKQLYQLLELKQNQLDETIKAIRPYITERNDQIVLITDIGLMYNSYEKKTKINEDQQKKSFDRVNKIIYALPQSNQKLQRTIRSLIIDELVLYSKQVEHQKIRSRFEEILKWIEQGFNNCMSQIEIELFKLKIFKDDLNTWPKEQKDQFRIQFDDSFEEAMLEQRYFTSVQIQFTQIELFRTLKYETIQSVIKTLFNDKFSQVVYDEHRNLFEKKVKSYIQDLAAR